MPPERTSRPRQEPVSCDSCRKKKLRCDRTEHCSNCQARAITCVYRGRTAISTAPDAGENDDLRTENADIRARLAQLERVVFESGLSASHAATSSVGAGVASNVDVEPSPPTTHVGSPEGEHEIACIADRRWLEAAGTGGSTQLPPLTGEPRIRVDSLDTILQSARLSETPTELVVPCLEETIQFFRCYVEHQNALQHIIHVPSVDAMIPQLLASLQGLHPVRYSDLMLVLSILASIAGYWSQDNSTPSLFASRREALTVSMYWLRCALDVLEYVWRTAAPDLESIQAITLLIFLIYHTEGFSPMLRRLHASAVSSAKDIGMHLTDSTQCKRPEETQQQIIDTEMRRRVWWHLASTDWSLSLGGGPHEGTYSVQPKYMKVKKPRNITDEDLATRDASFSRPLSETTSSSYYLQRIRLGEICREVADVTWNLCTVRGPEQASYEEIIALDHRFAELLDDIPIALKYDQADQQSTPTASIVQSQLAKQRYFTYLTVHVRRSKLHLPFLLRTERDKRYAFSREVCLSSARSVLSLSHLLPTNDPELHGPVRLIGVLHHFFCALVVLVMDVCINKSAGNEDERKAEVQEACKIFVDAGERCSAASTFLESLMAILRKHKVRLQQYPVAQPSVVDSTLWTMPGATDANYINQLAPSPAQDDGLNDFNFDDMWQSYFDFGATAEPQNWDALFNDLDMRIV